MDLIEVLVQRAESIPEGTHTRGLEAIVQHAQAAVRHLKRGQQDRDESAFTDAIYRTNQAFEGSIKEAYRVFARKDPDHARPSDIEKYLTKEKMLRQRVLNQLSMYRKEWRNPSTHDYKLDFDEGESLLAIVTVCAFAIVLFDQIAERISYFNAQTATDTPKTFTVSNPTLENIACALEQFRTSINSTDDHQLRDAELVGALAGYLSKMFPDWKVENDVRVSSDRTFEVDIALEKQDERILIEVKRARAGAAQKRNGLNQLTHYMAMGGVQRGILFFHSDMPNPRYEKDDHHLPGINARIIVVAPAVSNVESPTRRE